MNRQEENEKVRRIGQQIKKLGILFCCLSICFFCVLGVRSKAASNIVMIDTYEVVKGDFSPGSVATIKFVLKNIGKFPVKNVTAQILADSGITPVYGESDQVFIQEIGANESYELLIRVDVPNDIEATKASITLSMNYMIGEEAAANSATAYIPVEYTSSLSINSVSVAESTKVGAKALISVTYVNESESALKNVAFLMDGKITEESKQVEIGTVEAGSSMYKDMYVVFTEPGDQNVEITVQYEDAEGNKYNKDVSVETISVAADSTPAPDNTYQQQQIQKQKDAQTKMILKIIVLIAIFVVGACILYVWRRKKD